MDARFRKALTIPIAVTAIFVASVVLVSAQTVPNVSGTWDTTFKDWNAQQNGNKVSGSYDYNEGRVSGTLSGNTLTGYWVEKETVVLCSTARDGSRNWGKIVFNFRQDGSGFSGRFGSCDSSNLPGGWSGTRVGGALPPVIISTLGFDVGGKYTDVITTFGCAADVAKYGEFLDLGYRAAGFYCGSERPAGYYVWYQGAWAVWRSASGIFPEPPPVTDSTLGFDVGGKYIDAIATFGCAADVAAYGEFYDFGYWGGGNYCGADRPAGYYVWYQGAWAVWSTLVK
jgi:hypothetical protein